MKRIAAVAAIGACLAAAQRVTPPREAEDRGVAYLVREVPRWRAEHPCYSCHNNGDAARALIAAGRRGHRIGAALDGTLEWLTHPERWDQNKREGGFDDKALAHVQFAGGLTSAHDAKLSPSSSAAVAAAAALVAADQKSDGAWRLDTSQSIVGSPVTYGSPLVTWSALRTLKAARDRRFDAAIARGETWLRDLQVATVLDAAAVILALDRADDARAAAQRARCLEIIQKGQAPDGGWGPYVTSASEPFDTAVVLLALTTVRDTSDSIESGRRFLIEHQLEDGSWPETTRPPNQESYAQRISTSAWALLALMETSPR